MFRPGYGYKKAGILLYDLRPANESQIYLFSKNIEDNDKMNNLIDLINKRFGKNSIRSAACETGKKGWTRKAEFYSPEYTTNWNQLPELNIS